MKGTKKLTLSAACVALGAIFMVVGGMIEVLDLTAVALSSVIVAFVFIELGSPYTWLVWLTTSLITALLSFARPMWMLYFLCFGLFPILKGYIERLPRWTWLLLKLIFANLAMLLAMLGCEFILGIPFIAEGEDFFGLPLHAIYIVFAVLLNIAFIAYDIFLGVMVRFYMYRLRDKFKPLLK